MPESTSLQQDSAFPTYPPSGQSNQGALDSLQQSNAAAGPSSAPQSRQAAEEARKDRTLAEFMLMLDEYEPLVSLLILVDCGTALRLL